MRPTRAAWLFAAGLTWLVLRGILEGAMPVLAPPEIADHGGWLLLIPALSLVASLTVPLFFASFLRFHDFVHQGALRATTAIALVTSFLGFAMVLVTFLAILSRRLPATISPSPVSSWTLSIIPPVLVGSLLAFLLTFWLQERSIERLRKAAGVAAVGALVSTMMALASVVHSSFPGALAWYPGFSRSLLAKLLGLAAAGSLLWFLETFAVSYDDDGGANGSV